MGSGSFGRRGANSIFGGEGGLRPQSRLATSMSPAAAAAMDGGDDDGCFDGCYASEMDSDADSSAGSRTRHLHRVGASIRACVVPLNKVRVSYSPFCLTL